MLQNAGKFGRNFDICLKIDGKVGDWGERAGPFRPLLRSATSPVRGGFSRAEPARPEGLWTFPQTPFSLTFFEKKVSKEAFNISTKKHLLAGHTHTGQQVLLFYLFRISLVLSLQRKNAKKERKERTPRFSTKFSVINSAYSTGLVEKWSFTGFPQKSPQTVQNNPPAIFRGAIGSRGVFHETNTPYYDYYHSIIVSANGTAKYTSSHLQNTAPAVENRRSTLPRDL